MKKIGIYVHIPFCEKKCDYCDFCSNSNWLKYDEKYVEQLIKELWWQKQEISCDFEVNSIFFGGGTPSLLRVDLMKKIIEFIKNNFKLFSEYELTIECNPRSLTKEKIDLYNSLGVNRLSIGVQSLNDNTLKAIGRKQTREDALRTFELLKKVNYKNFNIDYIIGLPFQTLEDIKNDIKLILSYSPKHISMYSLILEEKTLLYKNKKEYKFLSDDEIVDAYDFVYALFKKNGYHRYEISNFCKPNYECKHNENYWQVGEYLGAGVSAHSYYNSVRYGNANNFDDYLKVEDFSKIKSIDKLSAKEKVEEYIMLQLRTSKGINLKYLKENLGHDLLKEKKEEILKINDFIDKKGDFLSIKEQFFNISNKIIEKLI